MDLIFAVGLLLLSAGFSGLTLGLLSLTPSELKRKMQLGDVRAAKIYPLRERGNQLLVTLIIGNVLVNSILSVFLGELFSGLLAVVIVTTMITIFGEILPQAVFSRYALAIGSAMSKLVEWLMLALSPIAAPLAKSLDWALGKELPPIFSKEELVKIVEEHSENEDSDVEADELRIVENALSFGDKTIEQVMTPRSVVVAVDESEVIGPKLLDELHKSGHSRFPVYSYDLDHITGTLYLRELINLKGKKTIKSAADDNVFFVNEKQKLDHVLNAFVKTKHHLYIVVNEFKEMVGIVTIEDVIEEIIGREIVDEFDRYDDMRAVASRKANAKET